MSLTMCFRYVLLVEILVVVLAAKADSYEGPQTYCGKHLTRTLSIFCKGRYNSFLDEPKEDPNYQRLDAESPYTYKSSPQITGTQQSDYSRAKRRIRRQGDLWYVYTGIVDECCNKPCTLDVLMSYCRVPINYVVAKP